MDRDTNVTAVTEVQAGRGPARDTVLLGKYRVESTLGFGGMGLVIKAHNLALDEHVAIKLLREDVQVDNENATRFVREAKNAVKLKSEHVARIRDVGTFDDGRPYMVMELLEGLDLGKILLDQGVVERDRAVDLVLQACDAIAEAHSLGIVHRDIKPTNLFVTKRRDGTDLLKVLDFGISKATMGTDMNLTQTQSMLGTPAYMSPEQMRSARTVDPRSDIWSLGCVLYELVEGHPPFEAENFAELCVMVSIEPFTPIKNAPELAAVIDKVLAKPIEQRFQSIAELAHALEPFSSDPERARRQVARVFRVLGRSHPEGRDSTPTPMPMAAARGSSSRISQPRISSSARPQTPIPNVRDRSGLWKMLLALGALAVIGAGSWMLLMGQDHDPDSALEPAAGSSADAVEPAPAGSTTEMTVERADAAVEATEAVSPA
ncbi:MAG TPA: serine/threonine-protein kinase, partial [Kofleriaceae bacterium]|nr:serine/threonine-protein kinase [Kofleriaceae bacterium]